MRRPFLSALVLLLIACGDAEKPATPVTASTESAASLTDSAAASTESATSTAPTATPSASATPAETLPPHDVTGAYFSMSPLPAEFAELDHLLLATIDENANPAPLNGFLRQKAQAAKDYTLVNPAMNGRNLTFTTIAVDGVHYEFTGAFDLLDNFAANPPAYETTVLTGTLTKHRNGQRVASTPVKYRYEAGG